VVPILETVCDAGATSTGIVPLQLPDSATEVFTERLRDALPLATEKVLTRVREMRDGKLNDSRFGARMQGSERYIETVLDLFDVTIRHLGMQRREPAPDASTFRRPGPQLD